MEAQVSTQSTWKMSTLPNYFSKKLQLIFQIYVHVFIFIFLGGPRLPDGGIAVFLPVPGDMPLERRGEVPEKDAKRIQPGRDTRHR